VGVTEEFVKRGEAALRALEESQRRQIDERGQTPAATQALYNAQGVLYTRTRFIVRIAQVEFREDDSLLGRYSYAPLRRQQSAAEGRRSRKETVSVSRP